MKTKLIPVLFLVLFAGSMLNSCKKSTDNSPVMFLKVGLVGGPKRVLRCGFQPGDMDWLLQCRKRLSYEFTGPSKPYFG